MKVDIYEICKDFPLLDEPVEFQVMCKDEATGIVYHLERHIYDPKKAVHYEQTKPFLE